ncbi:unnamed protein product [Caretta caretta]
MLHRVGIVIAALLRVFLAPIFANDNVNENNQGNNGRNSHQTVSINNDKHVANIDSNNGWNSWNSVWDYGNGFISTRILSKKACIIAKINEKVMPDVVELPQLIKEKMKAGSRGPPPVELRFTVSETRVSDLALYGKSVEAMCRGIPTYVAREAQILLLVFLGIFMNPVFASNNIQLINQGNHGGTAYQTVNINHDVNVAIFNIYSGAHSSNAIFNYNHGIIAYHMPYICVVSRMNRATFPTLNQLEDMVNNQRDLNSLYRSYGISRNCVTNVAGLGAPIQAACRGLSTYWATEYDRPQKVLSGTGCIGVKLLILDVNLCGSLKLF